MIQFNLLPDIKQEYIKAQRQKHLVVFVSTIASLAAVGLLIVLVLVVDVWQKKSINDLSGDIKSNSSQLSSTQDLNKILTVQNQLNSLGPLHDKAPVASRLFDYLSELTPAQAPISKLTIDYTKNTLIMSGNADAVSTIQNFVDTLKVASYTTSANSTAKNAFSQVVLSSFGKTSQTTTYTITTSFDPIIFSNANDVTLKVPLTTVTDASAITSGIKAGN